MQGLTDDQITDLKLVDEWAAIAVPSGGSVERKDEIGRRNGMGIFIMSLWSDLFWFLLQ